MNRFSLFGLVSLLLIPLSAISKPFEPADLTSLNKLNDFSVSPDQSQLVYSMSSPAWRNPQGQITSASSDLYLINLNGEQKQTLQLTNSKAPELQPVWSADGKWIYFLANRTGSWQLWRIATSGGEAQQVTELALDIQGFQFSSDGKRIVLAIEVEPNCADFACTKQHMEKQNRANKVTYERLLYRHWDTWEDGLRSHLFVAEVINNGAKISKPKDIMPGWDTDVPARPFSGMEEVAFNAKGDSIVFSAKFPAPDQAWHTNFDLFEMPIEGGRLVNLTEQNKGWDAQPTFSEDGRFLAYLSMKEPGYESGRYRIMLRDLRSGAEREVAPLWDRSALSLAFTQDNRSLIVKADDLGQRSLFAINTTFGDVKPIFQKGHTRQVAVLKNDVIFINHSLGKPADLYQAGMDGFGYKALTNVNQTRLAGIDLGEYEQFSFAGWNNEKVHGYWVKPYDFKPEQKYPVAFIVHGGPQVSFQNLFHYRWNAQMWAAQGYAVVIIDFHGSPGYGQAFTDAITGDWGGKPLQDLQKGFAYLQQNIDWMDMSNACALGASYGGYMMNWIAGNWNDAFKCIVNHSGIFDLKSMYYSTEELWFVEHDLQGPEFGGGQSYQQFNPMDKVANWRTPMLLLHGDKDFRVPISQSFMAFTALQRQGIPSRLVRFPDENHWILQSYNLEMWYQEVFDWMARWTR